MQSPHRVLEIFEESIEVISKASNQIALQTVEAANLMVESLLGGGKLLICGNGGSAADAQHFSAEMLNFPKAKFNFGFRVIFLKPRLKSSERR